MSDDTTTRQVPLAALSFAAGDFELGDNGVDAKTAPFRMVARSGQPIDHWYWGKVVHDMDGVKHKQRVPIDYAHDDKEVIGYANHFSVENGDLVVTGALVPYKDNDRASEVVHKFKQGVPYEASINFGGDGIELEEVGAGKSTTVNGYTLSGPATVIRRWPLRGVAVCPYGADSRTSTEFANQEHISVRVTQMENTQELEAVQDIEAAVESQPVDDNAAEAAVEEQPAVEAEPEQPQTELSQPQPEGLRFLEAFGDRGGVWFAQGLTFDQAQAKFIEELKAENAELRQRASVAASSGEAEPVSFSESKPPKKKLPLIRMAGKKYD